jgi:hypothetical protein
MSDYALRIIGPPPHPGVAYYLAEQRKRREEHEERQAYRQRVMTRAASGSCPACHFGGFDGVYCFACTYQPSSKINGMPTSTGREPVSRRSTQSPICPHCKAEGQRPWVACRRCGHRNWDPEYPELRSNDSTDLVSMPMEYSNPAGSKILSVR